MASVFDNLETVGQFARPRWPEGSKPHALLWPVWFRRLSTPARPEERLGPFERAVLNCARAGITDSRHVGDLLCIDFKLVEVIQGNLRSQGGLRTDHQLSEDGLAALDAGAINSVEVRTVYTFTCAMTGALLPRFTEQLFFAEFSAKTGRIVAEKETSGEPNSNHCFRLLPPDGSEPPAPEASEVLRGLLAHVRDRQSETKRRELDPRASTDDLPVTTRLNRVHVVDQRARPLFLATIAYRDTQGAGGSDDFLVADPFGLGASRLFRNEISRLRRTDRSVQEWLKKVADHGTPGGEAVEEQALFWQVCKSDAVEKLGLAEAPTRILDELVGMEFALHQANDPLAVGPQRRRALKQAGQAGRDALEAGFRSLSERFPLQTLSTRIANLSNSPYDERLLQAMTKRACTMLGFRAMLPQRFFRVRPRDLQSVVVYGHFSKLAAVVVASLLVASEHADHPFKPVGLEYPDFLEDISTALEIAGEAAHHNQGGSPDPAAIDWFSRFTYRCIRALLASTESETRFSVPESTT